MAAIWPERAPERARHALSQTLYELRRVLGEGWLESQGDRLRVTDAIRVDANEFQRAAEAGELDAALALYGGEFLAGSHLVNTRSFEAWVDRHRSSLQRIHRKTRRDRIEQLLAEGDVARALVTARRWAEVEPQEDEAHHRIIELLTRKGNRAEAIRQYETYETLLAVDDLEPLDETRQLIARLRAGEAGAASSLSSSTAVGPSAVVAEEESAVRETPRTPSPATHAAAPTEVAPKQGDQPIAPDWWLAGLRDWPTYAGLAAVVLVGVLVVVRFLNASGLDPRHYAVMPFTYTGDAEPEVGGRMLQLVFREAIMEWEDVVLADPVRLNDALQRAGDAIEVSLDRAVDAATRLGAGRVLMGDYYERGDTLVIIASLIEVNRRGRPDSLNTEKIATPRGRLIDRMLVAEAVNRLLHADAGAPPPARSRPTRVYGALLAMGRGDEAEARWQLDSAAMHYRAATQRDPLYAEAWLKLAQSLGWARGKTTDWRDASLQAGRLANYLTDLDRDLARATAALARAEFSDACAHYQRVIEADAMNFAGWIGLGNCHAWDPAVVPDNRSPSKYRFRSSYQRAFEAYRRAIQIAPSANFAFAQRLDSLLFLHPADVRSGRLLGADSVVFYALPARVSDTLAFTPYATQQIAAGLPETRPASHPDAIEHSRGVLRELFVEWARAVPYRSEPHERLAQVLESLGEIRSNPDTLSSALLENRRAYALAADPTKRLRLELARARLALKLEDFAEARRLCDSLLAAHPRPVGDHALLLSGAAALLGRVHRTAQLLEAYAPLQRERATRVEHPLRLVETANRFLGYAAFGAPRDSLRALEQRSFSHLRSLVPAEGWYVVERSLLERPRGLAFGELGPTAPHRDTTSGWMLIRVQAALAQNDAPRLRRLIEGFESQYRPYRPGDRPFEGIYQIARIHVAIGDTVRAIEALDALLTNLEIGNPWLLEPVEAAAMIRAMALRSELAGVRSEHAVASRWARAVTTLWRDADSELAPVVRRMTGYLESNASAITDPNAVQARVSTPTRQRRAPPATIPR